MVVFYCGDAGAMKKDQEAVAYGPTGPLKNSLATVILDCHIVRKAADQGALISKAISIYTYVLIAFKNKVLSTPCSKLSPPDTPQEYSPVHLRPRPRSNDLVYKMT